MARVRGITEPIGGTPLLRLDRISDESGAEVFGAGGCTVVTVICDTGERRLSTTRFGGQG